MVPLAPSIRLVQEDANYISLQGVYEDHCRRHNLNKDDPVLFTMEKLRTMAEMKNNRYPDQAQNLRMDSGKVWGTELIPNMLSNKCLFHNTEPVPFRLTPNLQTLMGPISTEGIYACAIMAIARCLTDPDIELEQQLSVFVRDEVFFWFTQQHRSVDGQLRERVQQNSDQIVKKSMALATPAPGSLPAHQTIIDTISAAVDPMRLAQSDALWMPYL